MDASGTRILGPRFSSAFFSSDPYLRSKSLSTARRKATDAYSRGLLSHCQADPSYRFFPFEKRMPAPVSKSSRASYTPVGVQQPPRSITPLPKPARGDSDQMDELRNLIEMSVSRPLGKRNKRTQVPRMRADRERLKVPMQTTSVLITQDPGKENDSLRDTIDSQVLNSELHYIENLEKAGIEPAEEAIPQLGDCPLQALRSFDVKKRRRNPLPLHGVLLPNPTNPLVTDPSDSTIDSPKPFSSQGFKRLPTAVYRLRIRKDSRKPAKNSDCLKVSQVKFRPLHEKTVSLFSDQRPTETAKFAFCSTEVCESDDSDSDPLVSRPP